MAASLFPAAGRHGHRRCRPRSGAGACQVSQRGAYTVEFALVFLLFLALLYATLCYGVLTTVRLGLQNAAEDGARAALRYPVVPPGGSEWSLRLLEAQRVAGLGMPVWPMVVSSATAQVCLPETGDCTSQACTSDWAGRCQIRVTVTSSGLHRLLPVFQFALPDVLIGQASLLLDGRTP